MRITAPGVFVGATWIGLFAAAIYYVARFASPDPFGDEWDLVAGVTYQEPYLKWLWAQHNEHRLPLPKLIYTWLLNLSGLDFRVGGFATATVLGALSLAFIFAARRVRGTTEYADAFFPIAFLNWGHFENYLIGFQISFAISIALACCWLLSALSWTAKRNVESLKWMSITLVLMPLCGAHGLVYSPPLGLATYWLARSATRPWRIFVMICTAVSWLLCAAYFRNYASPTDHPPSTGIVASLTIALEVLSLGWGWVGQMTWPLSGLLMACFVLASAVLALKSLRTEDRDQVLTILAVVVGTITLAFGIGWGRSGFGSLAGFAVRYGILMLPLMAACYLLWVRNGGKLMSSLVPMGMLTLSLLFLTQHCRTGLSEGRESAAAMAAFADDLRNGKSADELAAKHPRIYPHADRFAARIRVLQWAEVPRYQASTSQAKR